MFSMFSKFELFGAAVSVGLMITALMLIQDRSNPVEPGQDVNQVAAVAGSGIVVVSDGDDVTKARTEAILAAANPDGTLERMIIDDIKIGNGAEATNGATVSVHYAGNLQSGEEFDNSRKRGQAFQFTVGSGQVIKGWDEGVVGMKVGGERILVIPPEMAYGENGIGPIPPNATLVFKIELLNVK